MEEPSRSPDLIWIDWRFKKHSKCKKIFKHAATERILNKDAKMPLRS